MKIEQLDTISGSDTTTEDLLNYLSQIMTTRTDDEIRARHDNLKVSSDKLKTLKNELKDVKENLISVSLELKTFKALNRVLNLIDTLKREGVLVGRNRVKISRLLYKIQDQDFQTLLNLEKRLTIYLPDNDSSPRVAVS